MKTLISSTEDSATYEFVSGDTIRVVEYVKSQPSGSIEEGNVNSNPLFDHDAMSKVEYQSWLVWVGSSIE